MSLRRHRASVLGNALVIHKKISENLVYEMTKTIFTNLGRLKGVHPAFGRVNKNTVLNGFCRSPASRRAENTIAKIGVPGVEEFVKRSMSN